MTVPRLMDPEAQTRLLDALNAYQRGALPESAGIIRRELLGDPGNFLNWYSAGILVESEKHYEHAIACLEQSLALMPRMLMPPDMRRAADRTEAEIRFNLGRLYQHECEAHKALRQFDRSLALDDRAPGTWAQRGLIMLELGRPLEAERNFTKAITLDATAPNVRFNRALAALVMGDYERGFQDYEARWETPEHKRKFERHDITAPLWDGQPTTLTVLIHCEQGRGDQIHVARFLPEMQRRAPRLVVEAMPEMLDLLQHNYPTITFYARVEPLDPAAIPHHDMQIPSMSLFRLAGVTLKTIPPAPYLTAPDVGPAVPDNGVSRAKEFAEEIGAWITGEADRSRRSTKGACANNDDQ